MKYAIVYSLDEDTKRYQNELVNDISQKFKTKNLNKKINPHITFKSPFETEYTGELEKTLDSFTKATKKSKIILNGFGNFEEKVLYINAIFPEKSKKTFRRFMKSISGLDFVDFNEYDLIEDNFHSTIALPEDRKKFYEIKKYLINEKERPIFVLDLDNITIIKKESGLWKDYMRFDIK